MTWTLQWNEAAQAGAEVCGGKGWNLGRLHRYGFPVPKGGVLVAAAYERFLSHSTLAQPTAGVGELAAAEVTTAAGAERISAVHNAVLAAPLPDGIAQAVEQFLAEAGLTETPVAVRSSATAEDGAEASFAGIHQSFLGVTGLSAVLEAVKGCYASLWTPQAIAYRRRQGLADGAVACAVVICAMVTRPGATQPASAGVAFACDPRTGRRDLVTLSAAPGLGEAVVGGTVNPEEIRIRKRAGGYSVAQRAGRPDQVLTDAQALALARLTDRVHWALGDDQAPQDVEWAHDGERFWLLQARPVTRLPHVTFPGAERFPIIWSNANLKDAVAGVQSTFSWSHIKYVISEALYSALPLAGYPVPAGLEVVRRFAGRAYFDLTAMMWAHYEAIGQTPTDLARVLGGHQPLIPVPPGDPFKGPAGSRRNRARVRFVFALRRVVKELPGRIADTRRSTNTLLLQVREAKSNEELLTAMDAVRDLTLRFTPHFQAANMNAGVWPTVMEQLLDRFAPGRSRAIVVALLAGSGAVTSAEHGYLLFDLARAALQEPAAMACLTAEPLDPGGWRNLPEGSAFRRELESFLVEFGHRAVYEGELSNPRWREDPSYLLEQVRHLALAGRTEPPREAARRARAAGEAELARLPFFIRPLVRWLARNAQQAASLREGTKSVIAAIGEIPRLVALATGRQMEAAGVIDQASDVFHLAGVEMEMFLRGEWDGAGARTLVADRKARDAAWRAVEPPDSFVLDHEGRPADLPTAAGNANSAPRPTPAAGPGTALSGVGVAAGKASGVARVIRHPSQPHLLQDGDVLVAPSTDPGWTPLFLRASAVVMEVGGYLSHGAIVAREYGLPAVVNIPGLLGTVRDGQRVVVDGDAGTVTLLEE